LSTLPYFAGERAADRGEGQGIQQSAAPRHPKVLRLDPTLGSERRRPDNGKLEEEGRVSGLIFKRLTLIALLALIVT
jgi:hypothetical protein